MADPDAGPGGGSHAVTWIDAKTVEIRGTRFVADQWFDGVAGDVLYILKGRELIEQYIELIHRTRPKRIVELGIFLGGSVGMIALLADPDKLLAVDITPKRRAPLDELIRSHGLGDRVAAHYGVDQGDRAQLLGLVDETFGKEPIDLVVDDASHDLDLTRRSFEYLFPRLRVGGTYVIEDWGWGLGALGADYQPEETPLAALVFELIVALRFTPGLVDKITVTTDWVTLTRGPLEIDPDRFVLRDVESRRGRDLIAPLTDS